MKKLIAVILTLPYRPLPSQWQKLPTTWALGT